MTRRTNAVLSAAWRRCGVTVEQQTIGSQVSKTSVSGVGRAGRSVVVSQWASPVRCAQPLERPTWTLEPAPHSPPFGSLTVRRTPAVRGTAMQAVSWPKLVSTQDCVGCSRWPWLVEVSLDQGGDRHGDNDGHDGTTAEQGNNQDTTAGLSKLIRGWQSSRGTRDRQ